MNRLEHKLRRVEESCSLVTPRAGSARSALAAGPHHFAQLDAGSLVKRRKFRSASSMPQSAGSTLGSDLGMHLRPVDEVGDLVRHHRYRYGPK
jgi:hypothetical protein